MANVPFQVILVDQDDAVDRVDAVDVVHEISLPEIGRDLSIRLERGLKIKFSNYNIEFKRETTIF